MTIMKNIYARIERLDRKRKALTEANELAKLVGGQTDDSDLKKITNEIKDLRVQLKEEYRKLSLWSKFFAFGQYGRYL